MSDACLQIYDCSNVNLHSQLFFCFLNLTKKNVSEVLKLRKVILRTVECVSCFLGAYMSCDFSTGM